MTEDAPHVPAAFINAIREEGTKEEACDWLQKTWNEVCALRARLSAPAAEPAESEVERGARALLDRRGFGLYTDPMEGGQDAYDITLEAMEDARAVLASQPRQELPTGGTNTTGGFGRLYLGNTPPATKGHDDER